VLPTKRRQGVCEKAFVTTFEKKHRQEKKHTPCSVAMLSPQKTTRMLSE
jgi:hypothetical protein